MKFILTNIGKGTHGNSTTPLTTNNLFRLDGDTILPEEPSQITNITQIPQRSYNDLQDLPIILSSSETDKGIIQIATEGEVNAGTDDSKAITPLKLTSALNDIKLTFSSDDASVIIDTSTAGKVDLSVPINSVQSVTGTLVNNTDPLNPVINAPETEVVVEDNIVNGVIDKAPSQNAVFDALAGKQDLIGYTPANDLEVIKSASINGGAPIEPVDGNVALTIDVGVETVTGTAVDNTDPSNPIINIPMVENSWATLEW